MQHYIGTKITKATPMTRAAYNEYRGWTLPADENGDDEGFLVEYLDGGAANHPDHAGYISWSPKNVHERAYLAMGDVSGYQPHEQRVIAEKVELDDRISKLSAFFSTPIFFGVPSDQQSLLRMQHDAMKCYASVLDIRIKSFKEGDARVTSIQSK